MSADSDRASAGNGWVSRLPGWSPFAAVLLLGIALSACGGSSSVATPTASLPSATVAVATATATSTATAPPTATRQPTSTATTPPTATQPPSNTATPSVAATASDSVTAAIQDVINRANQAQIQALATQDPTGMQDTATEQYYQESVQGLNNLLNAGITAIDLLKTEFGPITLQGTDKAEATTTETWSTTFNDGGVESGPDKNVYSLVLEGGVWKIDDDQHPDQQRLPVANATPSATPATTPVVPGDAQQSVNWAGYAAGGGTFTAVTGSWSVPNISPSSTPGADATWVGIGGLEAHDLIQAGTDATVEGGQVVYTAWVERLPEAAVAVPLDVTGGDAITVTISEQAQDSWLIVIENATTAHSYRITLDYQSSRSSAEWIEEAPSGTGAGVLPLDDFGAVTISAATTVKDGQQQTIAAAGGQPTTIHNQAGELLTDVSDLGSDGSSFTVTRTEAQAP